MSVYKLKMRHTRRFQEIINTFLRHGLSHVLFRLGLTSRKSSKADSGEMNMQDVGVKLRHALQDLGPTFIKLGQVASSRRDLVPEEIAKELEKLQDHVSTVPFETIKAILEEEMDGQLDQFFMHVDEEPLAAASIGQVHVAQLHSGEQVAVKVQRPNIETNVEKDLSIIRDIASYLEENTAWASTYRLCDLFDEFSRSMREELDYRVEGRNCERIGKQFEDCTTVYIPNVLWAYSTEKVLTMEMVTGIKANQFSSLDEAGYDRKLIAGRIVNSMFHQILEEGFFHGDPHPGNIHILPGNVVSYLDFGMVGRISDDMKYHFASLLIDLRKGHTKGLIKTFTAMGILTDDTDMRLFTRDVEDLQSRYYEVALNEISLGNIFMELFKVAYRHHIQVPMELTILSKAILTLEGLITKLDPELSIMKAIEPYGKKLVMERYDPRNVLKKSWNETVENLEILSQLPKDFKAIATTVRKGKLQLDINVQQAQIFLRRLDRISNRLSFSIILLSFSILMVGLIVGASIAGQTNMLWRFPIIEVGSIVASLMFLYLIITIFKSGRM